MQVIGLFVKLFGKMILSNIIENCNLDYVKALSHNISQSTCVGQVYFVECIICVLFVLFCFLLLLSGAAVAFLNKLDFQNGSVTIIDVSQPVGAAFI